LLEKTSYTEDNCGGLMKNYYSDARNLMLEHMLIVAGLDLAGVETKPTSFCKLMDCKVETSLLYAESEIVERTLSINPQVVAIDAPLCLLPERVSVENRTSVHLRESERLLLKRGIKVLPITLGPMRKLTERGIRLKEILQKKGFQVIEAYPGGAQDVLGIPRKKHGLEKLKSGLEKLGIEGLTVWMSSHELDAVTCAYVGKLFLEGQSVTFGVSGNGIVMPKGQ
jgi:predicted nuclease with RNAse H fold